MAVFYFGVWLWLAAGSIDLEQWRGRWVYDSGNGFGRGAACGVCRRWCVERTYKEVKYEELSLCQSGGAANESQPV